VRHVDSGTAERRSRRLPRLICLLAILGLVSVNAAEITEVRWLEEGFIEVLFDTFPPWNDWTMIVNGHVAAMEGPAGEVNVRPNGPVRSATGVFIGTDPWVSPLTEVEFPCSGTLQFRIPGVGSTNVFEFSLLEQGCCTATACAEGEKELIEWGEDSVNPVSSSGIPFDPPVAALISFGEADALGEVAISGQAGAALANAIVYVVNLSSSHQAYTTAAADGSFSLTLFAPPGSPVMIKHGPRTGPHDHRWRDLNTGIAEGVNPFPGTILHVPYDTEPTSDGIPFAYAGAIDFFADDVTGTANTVRSAWSVEGTMNGMMGSDQPFRPNDTLWLNGTVRLHSQAITATTNVHSIRVHSSVMLLQINDADGNPTPAHDSFMSSTMTATGLPIQGGPEPVEWGVEPDIDVHSLRVAEDGCIEGSLRVQFTIPNDLPEGLYRPVLWFEPENVPAGSGWVSAVIVRNTFSERQAPLPPIHVTPYNVTPATNRLAWRLMMDDYVLGTRGAAAVEDEGLYDVATQIVTQGAPFVVPPIDARTGLPIEYRLEPFLPRISFTDRRMPTPPLIPFDLPGGQLAVSIKKPDGSTVNLGTGAFAQSFNRTPTTRGGSDFNEGTVQMEDVYSLMVDKESFRLTFDQYGKHTITMTGWVKDIWGNRYEGGGTYEVWVAEPLDIDVGTLPGTPLAVGDAWNPIVAVHPRVSADVTLTIIQVPESDPSRTETRTLTGTANAFGTWSPSGSPITAGAHGEYRVDLFAEYTAPSGVVYAGGAVWGGVIMTPPSKAMLVAHGRRGLDSIDYIPNHWFVVNRDIDFEGTPITHTLNPYYNGDILWSYEDEEPAGASLVLGASIQDTVGLIEAAIRDRLDQTRVNLYAPGDMEDRIDNAEIPLFSATSTGRTGKLYPSEIDQIAYAYTYSERPGVRVREVISEEGESGGYWRLNTLYDNQPGVGILGDRPNDFKFQYVGTVFRDLESGIIEYDGQGSGWVFLPDDDALGNRVMPPFAGTGNGGWTTEGGPIMTVDGEEVHLFILPTGVRPGTILEVGETIRFAGHIMPTLDSRVEVTLTAPSGATYSVDGQANSIGYFYDPVDDITASEAGLWTADVRVWHNGICSGGATVAPYPSGDVLGSTEGQFTFYVVPEATPKIEVTSPDPGYIHVGHHTIAPVRIEGRAGNATAVDYVISIPGLILEQGQAIVDAGGSFAVVYDPQALHRRFPNVDLVGRDRHDTGLADTVSIALVAVDASGTTIAAEAVTLQGERLFIGSEGGL